MTSVRAAALPVAATLAVQTMVAFAMTCGAVMAPVAAPALGVPPAWIGYFVAIAYVGSMLGSVSAGGWIRRYGAIRISQIGLALCLGGLAFAASGWLPAVMLGGFVIGLGYGPTTPASSQILVRATPPSLISIVFSVKQTGVPAGAALAGALVPTMILASGWQGAALIIGIVCLALAVLLQPIRARFDVDLDSRAPVTLRSAFAPVGMVLASPRLAEMGVASFVYGGVQITLVAYLVTFLTESFGMSLVLAGFVMAVSQLASVIGRVLWGVVADRMLARRTMLGLLGIGMGLSALAAMSAGPHWPHWLLFAYAAVFGATAVGWNGVYLAEVARLAPAGQAGAATGGVLFFTFLGVVIAPPVFNQLLSFAGTYALAYAAFGLPALAIGVRLLVSRPQEPARSTVV